MERDDVETIFTGRYWKAWEGDSPLWASALNREEAVDKYLALRKRWPYRIGEAGA